MRDLGVVGFSQQKPQTPGREGESQHRRGKTERGREVTGKESGRLTQVLWGHHVGPGGKQTHASFSHGH